jgi:hypothetical protein
MVELLEHLNGGELIAILAVGGGLLTGIVAIVSGIWYKGREIALKQEMVSRGMSAEEIRMVLNAGDKSDKSRCGETKAYQS